MAQIIHLGDVHRIHAWDPTRVNVHRIFLLVNLCVCLHFACFEGDDTTISVHFCILQKHPWLLHLQTLHVQAHTVLLFSSVCSNSGKTRILCPDHALFIGSANWQLLLRLAHISMYVRAGIKYEWISCLMEHFKNN